MRSIARSVNLFMVMLLSFSLSAQSSSEGTEFWLAYHENLNLLFNDDPVFTVVIRADGPVSGSIEAAATGASIPFNVGAGATEIDLFPAVLYPQGSDVTSNFGLLITMDTPVQLSAFHYRSFFCEASSVLPTGELGTNYRITTPTDIENNGQPNSFVVAATQDNTEIEIIPSALTLGLFPAGQPIEITLDAGQTYQVQSNGDLTNSSVISTTGEPIAVFAGAREANMDETCFGGANSHVWDQVPPVAHFSDLYYFVSFNNQNGDIIKILALEDDTEVFFDCELETTLQAGESYRVARNQPTVISSTGPISLTQYNTEGGCNSQDYGDPNGLNYLPAALRSNSYRWFASDRQRTLASPTYFVEHAISIIIPLSAQDDIELDGSPLGGFVPFSADPNMLHRRLTVSGGEHLITSSSDPIQVYAYGFNEFDAYTMNLGYTVNEAVDFLCDCDPSIGTTELLADVGCPGETSTFTFSTTYPEVGAWYWVIEGDTLFDEIFVYEYIFENPGDYLVEVVVLTIDGCVYPTDTLVTVENCTDPCFGFEPSPVFSGQTVSCLDSVVQLSVEALNNTGTIDSIRWQSSDLSVREFGDTISFSPTTLGSLDLVVTFFLDNGCIFEYLFSLSITDCSGICDVDPPTVEVFGQLTTCVDSLIVFDGVVSTNVSVLDGPPRWISLLTGEIVDDFVVATSFSAASSYPWNFSFTLQNGCAYSFDSLAIVTVIDCDTADVCQDEPELELVQTVVPACVDSNLFLDLIVFNINGAAFDSIVYDTGDGRLIAGNDGINLTYTMSGNYQVIANAYRGECIFTELLDLTIENCPPDTIDPVPICSIYWPTAFSPNEDGFNETFKPFFASECSPTNYLLRIYDRWGGVHFESSDPLSGWDGSSRGKSLNPAVFVYVATYQLPNGEVVSTADSFTLLR